MASARRQSTSRTRIFGRVIEQQSAFSSQRSARTRRYRTVVNLQSGGCMGNRFSLAHVQKLCNPEPCPVRPEPFAYAQDRLHVSEVEGHITVSAQDLDMSLFFFS